jgi:hypothetical protein
MRARSISRGTIDRHGRVHNLTYRVGRHVPGSAAIFSDVLADMCSPAEGLPGQRVSGWLCLSSLCVRARMLAEALVTRSPASPTRPPLPSPSLASPPASTPCCWSALLGWARPRCCATSHACSPTCLTRRSTWWTRRTRSRVGAARGVHLRTCSSSKQQNQQLAPSIWGPSSGTRVLTHGARAEPKNVLKSPCLLPNPTNTIYWRCSCVCAHAYPGDYARPHSCIGSARRFMVPDRKRQDEVLVEVRAAVGGCGGGGSQ